jgi:hypothetical protein
MKKSLLSMALLGSLVSSMAVDLDMSKLETRAGAAIESVSSYNSGLAVVVNGALPIKTVHPHFSVEGDMRLSLLSPSLSSSFATTTTEASLRTLFLGGYGVYTHPIDKKINLRGRVGINFVSSTATVKVGSFETSTSNTDFRLAYGVGGSYDLGKNMSVMMEVKL